MRNILKKILFIKCCNIFILFMFIGGNCMAKTKLISEENVEYHDVLCDQFDYQGFFKSEVSYEAFLEDTENLIYLLETAYAGFVDMLEKGFDSARFFKNCENNFRTRQVITTYEISDYYYEYLKSYIDDTHCFINSLNFSKNFVKSVCVFFSDLYLIEKKEKFFVHKSNNLDLPLNAEVNIQGQYLFKYPSEGKNIYRVGKLADYSDKNVNVSFYLYGKEYELKCESNSAFLNQRTIEDLINYNEIETEKTGYIRIKTFIDFPKETCYRKELDKIYSDFAEAGKKNRTKEYVILDLRENGGGQSLHPSKFLNNLVTDRKIENFCTFDSVFLISPAIFQVMQTKLKTTYSENDLVYKEYKQFMKLYKKTKKTRFLCVPKNERKKLKSKFKGKLIIVVDKGTASSSELVVYHAKELFGKSNQIILVGENTFGCFNYGNIFNYQLRNSGISISLAQFKMGNTQISEGIGCFPDYWATNEDLIQALVHITGDAELSEKLKDINNNL